MPKKSNNKNVNLPRDYSVWSLLAETTESISKARTIELRRYGLTREQSHVLRILYEAAGSLTINDIISRALRRHNTVSDIIKRMEKKDLVKREVIPNDRQYKISMTPKGKALFENMPVNSITMAFSVLTGTEKKNLVDYLQKLGVKVRSMLGLDYIPPF